LLLFRFFFFGFDIARPLRISEQIKVTFQEKKKKWGTFTGKLFAASPDNNKKASTHLV
jgi:hypothetical protein